MNIYLLLGHPDKESYNGQLADAYEKEALRKGHTVRRQNIGEMDFDPVLWKGYKTIQELEPVLLEAQENLRWCTRFVLIYPVWWGSLPALLKGLLDRLLLPGFAFREHEKDPFWDKLLQGRSAQVITTADSPAIWLWWQYSNSDIHTIKDATLKFCGITPVKWFRISRVKYLDTAAREKKLQQLIKKLLRD